MNGEKDTHLGKKILYTFVIVLCSLILLLSAVGVVGVWVVERPISDAAVTVLSVVEESTGVVRQSIERVDQSLAGLEGNVTDIADSSRELSQNVTDTGLVLTLLPEEKEQQLTETATSVRDTFNGIRESIARGLDLYRSIDRIPFVNLPGLSDDQVDNLGDTVAQTEAQVASLRSAIADSRAGVAGAIDRVVAAVDRIAQEVIDARDELAQMDSNLDALEELSIRLQQTIPGILLTIAVILTFMFAFLIYTQVEVIRLYVERWRHLDTPMALSTAESLVEPAPEGEVKSDLE